LLKGLMVVGKQGKKIGYNVVLVTSNEAAAQAPVLLTADAVGACLTRGAAEPLRMHFSVHAFWTPAGWSSALTGQGKLVLGVLRLAINPSSLQVWSLPYEV